MLTALAAATLLAGCDIPGEGSPSANQAASPAAAGLPPQLQPQPAETAKAVPPQDTPLRPAGTLIEAPDAEMVAMVYHSFGGSPALDAWVAEDVARSGKDEFAKQELAKQRRVELDQLVATAAKVGRFTLPVRSELSEYDARYGEYYVGLFGGSSMMRYDYRGRTYRLEFVNKDEAQPWKVSPDEAKHIFERNGRSRAIVVTPTLEIVGFNPTGDGGALKLKVLSYVIDSQFNDTRLGTVTVAGGGQP